MRFAPITVLVSSDSAVRFADTLLDTGFVLGQSSKGLDFLAWERTDPVRSCSPSASTGELPGVNTFAGSLVLRAVVGGVVGRYRFLCGVAGIISTSTSKTGSEPSISVRASSSRSVPSGDSDFGGGNRRQGAREERVKRRPGEGPSARRRRS